MSLKSIAAKLGESILGAGRKVDESLFRKLEALDKLTEKLSPADLAKGFNSLPPALRREMVDGLHEVVSLTSDPLKKQQVTVEYLQTFEAKFPKTQAGKASFDQFFEQFAADFSAKQRGQAPAPSAVRVTDEPPRTNRTRTTGGGEPPEPPKPTVPRALLDQIDELKAVKKTEDPAQVTEFFKNLRKNIPEEFLRNKLDTPRAERLKPQDVLKEIQEGRPVTRAELQTAETYHARVAQRAQDMTRTSKERVAEAAKSVDNARVRGNVADKMQLVLDELADATKTPDVASVTKNFDAIRATLGEQKLLADTLDAVKPARAAKLKPEEINQALRDGRQVTRAELLDAQKHYEGTAQSKLDAKARAEKDELAQAAARVDGAKSNTLLRNIVNADQADPITIGRHYDELGTHLLATNPARMVQTLDEVTPIRRTHTNVDAIWNDVRDGNQVTTEEFARLKRRDVDAAEINKLKLDDTDRITAISEIDSLGKANSGDVAAVQAGLKKLEDVSKKQKLIVVDTPRARAANGVASPDEAMDMLRRGEPVTIEEFEGLKSARVKAVESIERAANADATLRQRLEPLEINVDGTVFPRNKFDVDEAFSQISSAYEAKGLLKSSVQRNGQVLSPRQIYDAMMEAKDISKEELDTLKKYYRNQGFHQQPRGAAQVDTASTSPASGKPSLLNIESALRLWDRITSNSLLVRGSDPSTLGRTRLARYDGESPNVLRRWSNGILDGDRWRWGVSTLALVAGPAFVNPTTAYGIQTTVLDAVLPGDLWGLNKHSNPLMANQSDIVKLMFDRWTNNGGRVPLLGIGFDTLEQAVKQYVSPELYQELTKNNKFDVDKNAIAKIAAYMGDKAPKAGENQEGYDAFRLTLAHLAGISDPKDTSWAKIADIANRGSQTSIEQSMTVGNDANKVLLQKLSKLSGDQVKDLSAETAYGVVFKLQQNRSLPNGVTYAEFGGTIQAIGQYFGGYKAKEGEGADSSKDPYAGLSGLAAHLATESVKSFHNKFVGTSETTNAAFVAATKKLTGVMDVSEGKALPPEKLLEIAIEAQRRPQSTREFQGYLFALQQIITNTDVSAKIATKPADGKAAPDIVKETVDLAYTRRIDTISNSQDGADGFYKTVLNARNLPADQNAKMEMLYNKLKDPSFRATPNGKIFARLVLGDEAGKKLSENTDNKAVNAYLEGLIGEMSSASANADQNKFAAGAQVAADQEAARITREGTRLQQSREQPQRQQDQKIVEIRKSFSEVARAVPGLEGKTRDIEAAFDTVSASGAFNRARTGSDPYSAFATELEKRGVPKSTIPALVEHVRNFTPN